MGLANLDLLTVGVVVAATGALGFTVYFSDRASATNRTFLWFSIITALWGVVNYLSYQFSDPTLTLWLLRGIIFFAAFQAFFLYEFFTVFPDRVRSYSWRHTYLLLPLVGAAAIVTLTPLAFSGFVGSVAAGQVAVVSKGPGLALFVLVAVGLVVRALWLLFRTLRKSTGEAREAVRLVLIGTAITFALIIFFNLILSIVFTNPRFVPLGALFMFPFIAFASYAILRDHLFNIKVVGTTFLVLILSIVSFADIIFSNTLPEVLLRVGVFILVLVFGVSLIRGVLREVEQRERIEKLAAELQETNARQEGLIHFIGHEVKGFLTKAQGVFSLMEEGELGPVPETMKPFVLRGLADTKDGVESVSDILKASNLKKGTVSYEKKPFDLAALVKEMVEKEKPTAEAKKLALLLDIEGEGYQMSGDAPQIADHVLRNLVENSINYTPKGSIHVSLKKEGGRYIFAVSDTGIGISEEDKARLFTEGGHGKDSQKVNVHSTGYGLFIAKQIVEAHGGAIRAESAGPGEGSTFTAEFPIS